jgi:hypothetical protein
VTIGTNYKNTANSVVVTIGNQQTGTRRPVLPRPPQEWIFELEADKKEGWFDRVNVTIDHQLQQERTVPSWPSSMKSMRKLQENQKSGTTGNTNYRSGSAFVATTQEANEIRTVPLWPSVTTTIGSKSQQCHCGHQQPSPTVPWWPSERSPNTTSELQEASESATVAISECNYQVDSANVAIRDNILPRRDDIDRPPQLSVSFPTMGQGGSISKSEKSLNRKRPGYWSTGAGRATRTTTEVRSIPAPPAQEWIFG